MDGVRRALGRQVRKLRTAQGLSQEQLGERADLHWTHISGIERAQYDLKLSTLTRVSRGLGVSLAALFAGIVAPRARRKRSAGDRAARPEDRTTVIIGRTDR